MKITEKQQNQKHMLCLFFTYVYLLFLVYTYICVHTCMCMQMCMCMHRVHDGLEYTPFGRNMELI